MANDSYTVDLLQQVIEFLNPYVDVRDGADGPRPNAAMSLVQECEQEIARLERLSGPSARNEALEEAACEVERQATFFPWSSTVQATTYAKAIRAMRSHATSLPQEGK